jgi:hypothetical protein
VGKMVTSPYPALALPKTLIVHLCPSEGPYSLSPASLPALPKTPSRAPLEHAKIKLRLRGGQRGQAKHTKDTD